MAKFQKTVRPRFNIEDIKLIQKIKEEVKKIKPLELPLETITLS